MNDWMITAVYGHDGKPVAQAKEWGSIAVAEVDLEAHVEGDRVLHAVAHDLARLVQLGGGDLEQELVVHL